MIKKLIIDMQPEDHAEIKKLAAENGVSMKKWVLRAIAERIRNDFAKRHHKVDYRSETERESTD